MSANSEWQVTGSARLGKRYTSCDPGAQAHPMCICGKDAACGLLSDGLFCLGKVRRAILDGGKITEFAGQRREGQREGGQRENLLPINR